MNVEEEKKLLRSAHIRAIRALRLAMTVLLDASMDITANFAGDPALNEPEEIEKARVRAWNTLRPLLAMAAKSIETFAKSGNLGADYTAMTIKQCEDTLELLGQHSAAKRLEPFLEKLRADPNNEILLLQAKLAGFRVEVEEKPLEAEGPAEDEGPTEDEEE
jgi:hypothetical protein